jgi:zinc transport system substrate-binding protein
LYQLSVECEGKEPKPKALHRILEIAKERHLSLVLAQKGYNNKGAEQIAELLALPVYVIDPYSKHYIKTLIHLAELIASHGP